MGGALSRPDGGAGWFEHPDTRAEGRMLRRASMSQSTNSTAVSKYHIEHLLIISVTVVFGLISATALFYHIWEGARLDDPFRVMFAAMGAIFAFGMAIMPAALAKPHGEAIKGATAQVNLSLVVFMVMVVDGALEWHAVATLTSVIDGIQMPAWWAMLLIIASFQVSMFMARGSLAASTSEQRELMAAEAERMAMIEARKQAEIARAEAHQEKLRIRREQYAASKQSNVVNLR